MVLHLFVHFDRIIIETIMYLNVNYSLNNISFGIFVIFIFKIGHQIYFIIFISRNTLKILYLSFAILRLELFEC